jgi:predicted oxidoreductase
LAAKIADWGYNGKQMLATIEDFNSKVLSTPESLQPPRTGRHRAVVQPPFFATEVQPAITFTHGGVKIDTEARVLDESDEPIPGLLAAGADGAGVYSGGYVGGLALGAVFGLQAAHTAIEDVRAHARP